MVNFQTHKANIVVTIDVLTFTGQSVTLNVTFSSTNDAKCLVLPAGNSIDNPSDVMLHNNASATIHAIGGEEAIFVINGLRIGTQYIAKCAQSSVLSTQIDFATAEFVAQPVIATTSSTDVTFRMTSSASGEISCIILPNNYAVPNASIVMSKNNGIGVYQNTVGAEGEVK